MPTPLDPNGLTVEEQQAIFQAANDVVEAVVAGVEPRPTAAALSVLANRTVGGVFVSLKRDGGLRACCGTIGTALPLGSTLTTAASRSANKDPRFAPIAAEEIPHLDAEVWLLSDLEPVEAAGADRADAVHVGRHGVQIELGSARGLLLPCVPVEHCWDSRTFLEQVCRKADLPVDAWKSADARLYIFDGMSIRGPLRACHERSRHSGSSEPARVSRQQLDVRPAAVAGAFYPGDARSLDAMVEGLLDEIGNPQPWAALLVPHAGLAHSGQLAARGFQRVAIPETVFVLAPKHSRPGAPWAVAPHDAWSLPGRTVAGDAELAHELAAAVPDLQLDAEAHREEHAIEVQLPILSRLAPEARVVGVVLAPGDMDDFRRLAGQLAEFLGRRGERPLLVISSDLNHFAPEPENRRLDRLAIDALQCLEADELYRTVMTHRISMCGVFAAVTVLETLRLLGGLSRSELVGYTNSGASTGDTSRVVGYASMVFG